MIIELQNQSIVELSVDDQGTTEEERNVAKTVVGVDARSNRIRVVDGLKFVFQNLSQLLLGHNELGIGANNFSRSDFIQRIKMRNSVHCKNEPLSPLSLQLESGSLCSGLPSWISALPATLRVLDISYNAIQMLTVCTCYSLNDPSTSNMKNEIQQVGEEERIVRYLRHISPNTISLFFSKLQFPVLEQLNISHNLLSSEIEDVKELEVEWCRVVSLASANNYERQENPVERCHFKEANSNFSLPQLQTAVLHLDLSWNDGIRCVNDFLFSNYPSHRKKSTSCDRSLKKLFLEHCGLNDFWGLSAVSYYAPHLEEIHLTATSLTCPLLESTTKNFYSSSENEKDETKQNRTCQKKQPEAEWLRTALLRLTISKKHTSNSSIPGLPSKYLEDVVEEIISSSTLLSEFKSRVGQIIRRKIVSASERTLTTYQEEPVQAGKSLREPLLSNSMYLDYPNVLLTVVVQLVVQNLRFVNHLSTLMCKESLLEAFYDEVKKLLQESGSATSQLNALETKTPPSGSEHSSLLQNSFTSRKSAAFYLSPSLTLSDENLLSKGVDNSHSRGDEYGLTASEIILSSSGSSQQEFSADSVSTKTLSSPQLNPTSSTALPSHSGISVKDVQITKKQRQRLLEQAAYLQRKVDHSFENQQRILLELKMLEEELTANRNTITAQTKHILSLKERRKELAKTIAVNRSTVRKRNTEVFHGLTALQFRLRKQCTPERNVTDKERTKKKRKAVSVSLESVMHKTRSEVLREATSKKKIKRFSTRHPFSYSPSRFCNGERLTRSLSAREPSNASILVKEEEAIVLEIPSRCRLEENALSGSEWEKLKPFQGKDSLRLVSPGCFLSSSPDCRLRKSFSSSPERENILKANEEVTPPAPSLLLPRMFSIIPPLPAPSKQHVDCSCQSSKKSCFLSSFPEENVSRSERFLLSSISTLIERAAKTDQKHSTLKQIHRLIGLQ